MYPLASGPVNADPGRRKHSGNQGCPAKGRGPGKAIAPVAEPCRQAMPRGKASEEESQGSRKTVGQFFWSG